VLIDEMRDELSDPRTPPGRLKEVLDELIATSFVDPEQRSALIGVIAVNPNLSLRSYLDVLVNCHRIPSVMDSMQDNPALEMWWLEGSLQSNPDFHDLCSMFIREKTLDEIVQWYLENTQHWILINAINDRTTSDRLLGAILDLGNTRLINEVADRHGLSLAISKKILDMPDGPVLKMAVRTRHKEVMRELARRSHDNLDLAIALLQNQDVPVEIVDEIWDDRWLSISPPRPLLWILNHYHVSNRLLHHIAANASTLEMRAYAETRLRSREPHVL
jgi:hypothetical protein